MQTEIPDATNEAAGGASVVERVVRPVVPPAIDGIPSITYGPWELCEDMPGIKAIRKVFINFDENKLQPVTANAI